MLFVILKDKEDISIQKAYASLFYQMMALRIL